MNPMVVTTLPKKRTCFIQFSGVISFLNRIACQQSHKPLHMGAIHIRCELNRDKRDPRMMSIEP